MKKLLLFGAIVFSSVIGLNSPTNAQVDVFLDNINVYVTTYGRIAIYSLPDTIRQVYKTAILVGTGPTTVSDLENDYDVEEPTQLMSTPTFGDYEIYGSYNNAYSSNPVSYTHLRAHETVLDLVCRLLLEKKKKETKKKKHNT